MTIPIPTLDDRKFQDLVNETKRLIPVYCAGWTDHNVSDPGVTLIELFAWMTENILYRLNKTPRNHYLRLMEMMGMKLEGPSPARTSVTFWLSKPHEEPVLIPFGTEVASKQTDSERSIVFTTDHDFLISPPRLRAILSGKKRKDGTTAYEMHELRLMELGRGNFQVFSEVPQPNDALYLGFENDPSGHIIELQIEVEEAGGAGHKRNRLPPYIWEVSRGEQEKSWLGCEDVTNSIEPEKKEVADTTEDLNVNGVIRIFLPSKVGKTRIQGEEKYWLRARIISRTEGHNVYLKSPKIRRIKAISWGATIPVTHAQNVEKEFLGRSDGMPGQRFQLQHFPVLPRNSTVEVMFVKNTDEGEQRWLEVPDFSASTEGDLHYTLDSVTGEVRLGPAIRQPDGTIRQYGKIPKAGTILIMNAYRFGGGHQGNVKSHVLVQLKKGLSSISRVTNRLPAIEGKDSELLEDAIVRLPGLLRARERAVTEDDFEFLVLSNQDLSRRIGRVKCLQTAPSGSNEKMIPGIVHLLIIPQIFSPETRLTLEQLTPNPRDMNVLRDFLDERRLLTTRLEVGMPEYKWVTVKVQLKAIPGADKRVIEQTGLQKLYGFINPLIGGKDGKGWPFGRNLYTADIYPLLQGIPEVLYVRGVELFEVNTRIEPAGITLRDHIPVISHALIASHTHIVEFVEA